MNNALLKRFLSVVMAVAMVMSMVVIPVAADEADGGTSCTEHNYVDGECQCGATEPKPECDHANKQEDVTPATCTEDGSKTVACNDCGETISTEIIGKLGHTYGENGVCECGAEKPAEKTAVDETPKECTCKVRCNEQAAEDCAVCKDNVNDCTGKTAEDIDAEQKAAVEAAAKEASDQKVAVVQALIDALPTEIKQSQAAALQSQFEEAVKAYNELTAEEQEKINNKEKMTYPTNIIDDSNYPVKIGDETYATLQAAIDAATNGATITFVTDIFESVKVTQADGISLVIDGAGKTFTGVMTVFGNGRQSGAETLTIQNITFQAAAGADSCIVSPDRNKNNAYSYSHNVTVSNCTFKGNAGSVAAIRQEDGGDKNWTVRGCTVDSNMHSLLQVNNVVGKLTVTGCTVNSKNGINLNACTNVEISNNTINVQGYAVRAGVNSGGNPDEAKSLVLTNNTLSSQNDDGDATIMLRTSAANTSLTLQKNAVTGTTHISGTTDATTVNADANYWGGAENPAVSGTEVTVTSYYADADRSELKPTSDVVAQVGSTYYTSIEDAITDLEANGGTLTLLADAEFTKTLMIASGKNVVIDLNGHTITGKDSNASGNYELIQNKGTLTITDSTEAKNGKITLSAASNRAWNSYSAVIANMGGTLNVNAGIIEHTGGTDMAYGIDNNSTLGTTTTNISGGTVTSTYRAIRQFANSTTGVNNLNISGGTISGGNKGVWLQSSNQNANKADLTITGGSVNSVYVWAPADTESKTTDASQLNIKIAANTVSGEVKNGLPERYEISSVDGNYVIMSESKNVVQIVETGALYDTVADAVNAAAAGQTIKLLNNIEPAESITIVSGKEITIDLNGKTISQSKAQTGAYSMIENNGNLTITDSTSGGKISYTDSGNGGEYVSNTIQNNGTLTVKGGTIENLSSATVAQNGYPHAIDTKGTLTVAGGTVTCSNYSAIRIWCDTTATDATISSGTINGTVDLHNVNDSANVGTLNITGGVLNPGTSGKSLRLVNFGESLENINAHVSGGTINGSFAIAGSVQGNDSGATYLKNVFRTTGGSYKVDPSPYCDPGNKGEIKDGVYSIVPDSATAVAEINGVGYTSLQAAVDSIPENGSAAIKLLTSVSTTTALTIPAGKTVILELGEYTLSAADGFSGGDSLVVVNSGASLTVASGTIDGSKTTCGIKVTERGGDDSKTATLNVTGGTVKGGTYGIAGNGTRDNSSITISGGNINGSTAGIFHPQNGTLTISGGSISGATGVYAKSGTITVSGGSVSGTGAEASYDASNNGMNSTGDALVIEKSADAAYQAPEVSVTGGTFTSTNADPIASYVGNEGEKLTGFVSGGSFNKALSTDVIVENYKSVDPDGNGMYEIKADEEKIVAKIGDTPYFSIEDAIADSANGTIVLAKSVELTAPLAITSVDTVKIDLNGFNITNISGEAFKVAGPLTLSGKGTVKGSVDTILMQTGGNLTVKDDVVVEAGSDCAILSTNAGNDDGSRPGDFTVTINGGKVTTASDSYAAIQFNGNATGVTLNVKGGEISANDVGIYFPCQGNLNISGGTVTGATGVYVKGGNLSVTGGTIKGTGTKVDYEVNGNGGDATGDALVVAKESAYQLGTVSITGGTFTSTNAAPIASYARDGQTAKSEFVSGGTFSGKTALSDDVVVASKRVPDNTSGTYTLEDAPSSTDANGNTTYYADLDEMLDKNVTSITLNANETLRENHGSVANGTVINANGKTIVGAEGGGKLTAAGQMVIENLGANKASMVLEAGDSVAFGTDGTMTIRGAYDDSVNYASVTVTHLKNNRMVTDTYLLSRDAYLTMNASGIIGEHPGAGGEITTLPYTLVPVGNVNTYVQASTATLKFESNMFYETFKEAYVDGTLMVSGKDYTVAKGSTIITLSNARLRALSVGKHTLTIKGLDSKTAECPFYVSANYYADTTNPKTGDSIFLALSVMLFTGCALAVIPFTLKKKIH